MRQVSDGFEPGTAKVSAEPDQRNGIIGLTFSAGIHHADDERCVTLADENYFQIQRRLQLF